MEAGTRTVISNEVEIEPEPLPFTLTPMGMDVHGQPTFDDWLAFGRTLHGIRTACQWAIGDWINYGQARVEWGEKYDQAIAAFDYDYGYLANMSSIANKFDSSRRVKSLSWSHHQAVARLPAPQQDELLSRAAQSKGQITRDDLREETKKLLSAGKPQTPTKRRIILNGLDKTPCNVISVNLAERFVVLGFENSVVGAKALISLANMWQNDETGLSVTVDQTVIEEASNEQDET